MRCCSSTGLFKSRTGISPVVLMPSSESVKDLSWPTAAGATLRLSFCNSFAASSPASKRVALAHFKFETGAGSVAVPPPAPAPVPKLKSVPRLGMVRSGVASRLT